MPKHRPALLKVTIMKPYTMSCIVGDHEGISGTQKTHQILRVRNDESGTSVGATNIERLRLRRANFAKFHFYSKHFPPVYGTIGKKRPWSFVRSSPSLEVSVCWSLARPLNPLPSGSHRRLEQGSGLFGHRSYMSYSYRRDASPYASTSVRGTASQTAEDGVLYVYTLLTKQNISLSYTYRYNVCISRHVLLCQYLCAFIIMIIAHVINSESGLLFTYCMTAIN